jgi:hypothetical protein
MSLSKILEFVSVGDTLRDTAGNRYSLDAYGVVGDTLTVTRLNDKTRRDVSASVAWAMMEDGKLWKEQEPPKKKRDLTAFFAESERIWGGVDEDEAKDAEDEEWGE